MDEKDVESMLHAKLEPLGQKVEKKSTYADDEDEDEDEFDDGSSDKSDDDDEDDEDDED